MKQFITAGKKALIILFWILVWQGVSMLTASPIILSSPFAVAMRLFQMVKTRGFWLVILTSFLRIAAGFLCGLVLGCVLAVLCFKSAFFKEVLSPVISLLRSIPVASFIVLLLLWVNTKYLSIAVGFLIVLPVVFSNIYNSLSAMDKKMLKMSDIYKVPFFKRVKTLYLSSVLPGLLAAISVGIGFCFKSGVAAEVIGICKNTIGEAIYSAKVNFETVDVFAWTVVIVVLSTITEYAVKKLIKGMEERYD